MESDIRMGLFNSEKSIQVPIQGQIGMMTSLQKNLRASLLLGFRDLMDDLFRLVDIAFLCIARFAVKSAEFAIGHADIGVIDITVNQVGGGLIALGADFQGIGYRPQ